MKSSGRTAVVFAILALMVLTASSQAKRGCASFGHSCFGGHGKRAETAPEMPPPNLLTMDPMDLQTIQLFRQLCILQPEQYLRLAPVFRKLAENYISEAEEPLPRK